MQDWAYEVSDPERIGEFLDAYLQEGMSEDERFTVMQTIIDSSERNPIPLEEQPQWAQIQQELRHNIALHASTIFYWSLPQEPDAQPDRLWRVTPSMRTIVQEMPSYFSSPRKT